MESDWSTRVQSDIPVEAEVQIDIATLCITASCKSRNSRLFAHGSSHRSTSSTGYLISHCPCPSTTVPSRDAGHHHHSPPTPPPSCDGEPHRRPPPTVSSLLISHCPLHLSRAPGILVQPGSRTRAPTSDRSWTRSGPTAESDLVQVLSRFRSGS